MSVSGILAASNQGTRAVKNPVNIKIEANSTNKVVTPGEEVSYVPKVLNIGSSCYLRVKVSYINEDINFLNYVTNFPDTVIRIGDYYYVTPVFK